MAKELRLIKMSNVEVEEVRWLWHPYIPQGKVTILQGDPGEGKTTFVLAMIALLTKGEPLPEHDCALIPNGKSKNEPLKPNATKAFQ